MNTLTATQVKEMLSRDPSVHLVMTLGPNAFAKSHIPGSINIYDLETATKYFSKNAKIIVYCSDINCMASYQAYQQLERAGYTNIWRFSGGLVEWGERGFPFESGSGQNAFAENMNN